MAAGVGFALSLADPDPAWADAMALDPAEAETLRFRLLAERRTARARSEKAGGSP